MLIFALTHCYILSTCITGQLPPRLARLQQQQLQQQQNQQSPPGQPQFQPQQPLAANTPQAMIMMQEGQMPIPFPNTSVPPPPLPKEEISLRPNRTFTGALRPSVPTMLPKSAQAAPVTGPPMMAGGQSFMEPKSSNLNPLLAKQVKDIHAVLTRSQTTKFWM